MAGPPDIVGIRCFVTSCLDAKQPADVNHAVMNKRSQPPSSEHRPKFSAPKWPDHTGAVFETGLYVFAKGIRLVTLNVNRANNALAGTVEHGNNNFRPRRAKGGEIPWIGHDIPTFTVFREEMAAPVSPLVM